MEVSGGICAYTALSPQKDAHTVIKFGDNLNLHVTEFSTSSRYFLS
jgi:hypothetical protein